MLKKILSFNKISGAILLISSFTTAYYYTKTDNLWYIFVAAAFYALGAFVMFVEPENE